MPDGENVAVHRRKVAEDLQQLAGLFAEANHDPGFSDTSGIQLFGVFEQAQSALVARSRAHHAIEARDGFGVVVEHFGAGIDDNPNCFGLSLEVWDQDFDLAAWSLAANLVDDHGEGSCAADQIVVAVNAGDDGVLQAENRDGFGDAARLVEVDGFRTAFGYRAEAAAARAEVAQHHEGGGLVLPALADVGAMSAFADGVQVERARQPLEVVVVLAHGRAGLEPLGFGRWSLADRFDLNEIHHFIILPGIGVPGRTHAQRW